MAQTKTSRQVIEQLRSALLSVVRTVDIKHADSYTLSAMDEAEKAESDALEYLVSLTERS